MSLHPKKMIQQKPHPSCPASEPTRSIFQAEQMSVRTFCIIINGYVLWTVLLFAATGFAADSGSLLRFLGKEYTPVISLLPTSLPLADTFKPSTQPFAGTVASLSGNAYVFHKNGDMVYTVKEDHPVFNGDTVVTGEKSRVTLQMSDDTMLTLTARTKLTIDKYLPRMKIRDTAIQLFFGRIRALVKKVAGEYTIRTPTGSIGVRGTDFAVAVAPAPPDNPQGEKKNIPTGMLTVVLTGDNQSEVEFAGNLGPSVMIKQLSVSGARTGGKAEEPVYVGTAALTLLNNIAAEPGAASTPKRPALPIPSLPKISVQPRTTRNVSAPPKLVPPKISLNIGKKPVSPKKFAPKSVPKSAPTTGPCWPFASTPNGLIYFRVCK